MPVDDGVLLGRLALERRRSEFRQQTLETFLLYLFTYEMPIDKVRTLVDKVVADALTNEFSVLRKAGCRREMCRELLERLSRVENSSVGKAVLVPGLDTIDAETES